MLALLALAGCSAVDGRGDGKVSERRPVQRGYAAVSDDAVKIGEPYTVGNTTYRPEDPVSYDEVGYASWYGDELRDSLTANGEPFNPDAITAAHRTLPLPSYVEITALDTGRTILARVNDRGPFSNDRLIDLSQGAARQLGISGQGHAPVRVRRVNPPESEKLVLRQGGSAPERLESPAMLLTALRRRLGIAPAPPKAVAARPAAPKPLAQNPKPAPAVPKPGATGNWFVQIGAFSGKDRAEGMAKRAGARVDPVGSLYRVRLGPYRSEAEANEALRAVHAKGYPEARLTSGG